MDTKQLKIWQSDFGDAYTDRNVILPADRLPGFERMVGGLELSNILEVGCNRGHNLAVLTSLFPQANIVGIEPNRKARELARTRNAEVKVLDGSIFKIPYPDGVFDFVFTAGVLIHIALADLETALRELRRVSSRYILSIEYWAPEETVIHYRGHDDLLWKRDFLMHYQKALPGLQVVRSGAWSKGECGMDEANWWLFDVEA